MAYNPSNGSVALQLPATFTTFLSQRDLSLQIPINYVTYAGVALTPACFPYGRYDDVAFQNCLSNLLAVGFRRIDADVYWDPTRSVWSLCPVELGNDGNRVVTTSVSIATSSRQTETQLASNPLTGREALPTPLDVSTTTSTQTGSTRESASTTITLSSTSSEATAPNAVVSSDETVVAAGPYLCSPEADLDLLISVMSDYMTATETDLNATTLVLTLNLHAVSSSSDPTGPANAPAEDDLPAEDKLLSNIISNNASVYLYTLDNLLNQRSNLNTSRGWFAVDRSSQPDDAFFTTYINQGVVSTPNGWPSEGYIEVERAQRFLVEYGRIDPQMSGYNFTGDDSTIFPQNFTGVQRAVSVDSRGDLSSGCFFSANDSSLSTVNSSWAITSLANGSIISGTSLTSILTQARNLTACGISPILNGTLNNATADQNFDIYQTFVNYTIWSWGSPSNEPLNNSSSEQFNDYRCATLNSTSGFWQAADCSGSHYGACRYDNQPYAWNITGSRAAYISIDLGCDETSAFDVPRTALENTYLLSTWRQHIEHSDDDDSGPLLWLDFNDLDIAGCWVIGQNGTCPYDNRPSSDTREVVVPTIAGIIVFILVILTILVKCAGNRQKSKRRRKRADDGWDYEGVPS